MKIALIISEINNGGSSYQIIYLAKELQKKGHFVTIYTLNNNLIKINPKILRDLKIISANYNHEIKPNVNQLYGFILYFQDLIKRVLTLKKLIDINPTQPDVINAHDYPTNMTTALLKITRKIPSVFTCNDVWYIPGFQPSQEKRIIFRLGDKYLISMIDFILTKSINTLVVLDHRIKGIVDNYYHKNAVVIRSGVDTDFFSSHPTKIEAREKLKLSKNTFIFLCMAIFLPHRRFEDAIAAFKTLKQKYPNAELLIVGSDAYDKTYSQHIKTLVSSEKSIKIINMYMTEKEKLLYISAADTLIFPNEKQTWGITVTEAMAADLPCIVSKGAGVHEIIRDNETGLLFPPRDTQKLFEQMKKIMQDKDLYTKIQKNAKKFVIENISWERLGNSMEKEFLKLL